MNLLFVPHERLHEEKLRPTSALFASRRLELKYLLLSRRCPCSSHLTPICSAEFLYPISRRSWPTLATVTSSFRHEKTSSLSLLTPGPTGRPSWRSRRPFAAADVKLASMLPLFRWSGPDEEERQAAVRYWKRAIEIAVELGCSVMNSEFNGRPEAPSRSEAQFWRSMEELLPIFEREGIQLRLEPHPDDFIEGGLAAIDLIRGINSPNVSYLHCAPHTFHLGDNMTKIMEYAGPLLTHVHVADSFDHRASSGNRYIINPPGSPARIHQHLDIGQGEVDWDEFFDCLRRLQFDGVMTVCVLAWEERASRVKCLYA